MKIQKRYQALIYLGILILTAQIGFRVYVLCNSKDIPPIDDSDLLLVRPNITPDQNAYSIFTSATNNLYYPEDIDLEMDYIWSDDDSEPITEAQIIEVIKKNKNLHKVLKHGVSLNHCFRNKSGILPTPASDWMHINEILLTKCKHELKNGDSKTAINTLIDLMNFGRLISSDSEFIIEHMVGNMIIGQSSVFLREAIIYKTCDTTTLEALSIAMPMAANLRTGYINGLKSEYAAIDEAIYFEEKHRYESFFTKALQLITGASEIEYLLQPNKTKKAVSKTIRHYIKQANLPYSQLSPNKKSINLPSNNLSRILFSLQKNSIGKIVIWFNQRSNYNNILKETYNIERDLHATKLVIALNLYKRKNDCLPESLDKLVPEYLPEIPIDPYDGQPFRYSKDYKTVYSVGKNLQDSGGEFVENNTSRQTCCGDEETGKIFLIHR